MDETDYAVKKVRMSSRHLKKIEKIAEVRILAQLDDKHIIRYYQAWIEPITREEQDEMAAERQQQQQLGYTVTGVSDVTGYTRDSAVSIESHDFDPRLALQEQRVRRFSRRCRRAGWRSAARQECFRR